MNDINTFLLLGSVLLTSIWSLVCLEKKAGTGKTGTAGLVRRFSESLSESIIHADGRLSMVPPSEQIKASDF